MKDSVKAFEFQSNIMDSAKIGRAQTKLRHYGSPSNNQLSGTRHCTSTSLVMKRHLTV
ncbi:unnamed protein product [Schistosoma curassoni]|uniref:Kinesin motor domain-containing protein n=1 Tax=Schistosoma curassoni TaxID=6186 RepID=A0A183KWT9_9TREM|nr:unnamed protein product [Schistosoma curassoni]